MLKRLFNYYVVLKTSWLILVFQLIGFFAFIGFDGNMDSNICIRTLARYKNKLYFHAGGGIVWDSNVDAEYKECFDKAAAMLKLFKDDRNNWA